MDALFMMARTSVQTPCPRTVMFSTPHDDLIDHAAEALMWIQVILLGNLFAACGAAAITREGCSDTTSAEAVLTWLASKEDRLIENLKAYPALQDW
mmetsp:Transcript_55591/g.102880  ORF Transcript_55591/g.102880 Transcript_55591/m.102880 type:complete len:96 (-) Transcript_55591:74-361(-)